MDAFEVATGDGRVVAAVPVPTQTEDSYVLLTASNDAPQFVHGAYLTRAQATALRDWLSAALDG